MARHRMKQLGYEETLIEEAIGHAENVPDEVKEARSASGSSTPSTARRPTASTKR